MTTCTSQGLYYTAIFMFGMFIGLIAKHAFVTTDIILLLVGSLIFHVVRATSFKKFLYVLKTKVTS